MIFIVAIFIGMGILLAMRKEVNIQEAGREGIFDIALRQAGTHDVPYALILAVIEVESSFDANAKRDEPKINDASYGLMQVLYKTAIWLGYDGSPQGLFNLETNIYYGAKYLRYQLDRYDWNIIKAIAAYNAGTAKYKGNGTFINQGYVDKVLSALRKWQGKV